MIRTQSLYYTTVMSQVEITHEKKPFRFACSRCLQAYDEDQHKALIICPKFHTYCQSCIHNHLLKKDKAEDGQGTCPQCEHSFQANALSTNTLLDDVNRQCFISDHQETVQTESIEKPTLEKQLVREKEKTRWLLTYCEELDSRVQVVQSKQKTQQGELSKKISHQQASLERLAVQFWRVRGDSQFQEENFGRMIQFTQQIISSHPTYDYNSHGFGNVEDQIGMFQAEPVKWYITGRQERNFRSSPYDILSLCYLITKQHEEAQRWYTSQLSKGPQNYQLIIGLANAKYNRGKYEQAEKLYKRIIELKPEMDRPYQQLAFIKCLKQNKKKDGRTYAETSLQKNPNNIYARFLLATTEEQLEVQLENLHYIVRDRKIYARAYNGLGTVYKEKKQLDESLKWYHKAIQINPKYDAPYYGVGLIHFSKEEYDNAIKWFEQCAKVNPTYQNAFFGLGSSYNKIGNRQEAINWYKKCLTVNHNNSKAQNALGSIYAIMEDYDQAEEHLKKCIELDPNHSLSLNSLGNVCFYKGNYEEAIKHYQKCIEINPRYGAPYNGLSNVYSKKGDEQEAKKWYEKKMEIVK